MSKKKQTNAFPQPLSRNNDIDSIADTSANNYTAVCQLVKEVKELYDNTPEGKIIDADTVLADVTEKCVNENQGMREVGLAMELLEIWENSEDKKSVEEVFHLFTDMTFVDFLEECKKQTTRCNIPLAARDWHFSR